MRDNQIYIYIYIYILKWQPFCTEKAQSYPGGIFRLWDKTFPIRHAIIWIQFPETIAKQDYRNGMTGMGYL